MSAEPQRTINWKLLEGKLLEGGYEVQNCLATGQYSATFQVRILGDRFTNAAMTAFAPGTVPPEQLSIWQETLELRNDYLNLPLAVGRTPFDGASATYVITVVPDETLEGVLRERALSPEEARQVVDVAVGALESLHENGFVHAALSPSEILAIGDSIRLSVIRLRRGNAPLPTAPFPPPRYQAPEAASTGNLSRSADVYCLGATVFEILTRKPADSTARERAGTLPEPFKPLVECALDPDPANRCSLSEVHAILGGNIPDRLRPKAPAEPEPAPVREPAAAPEAAVVPDDPAPANRVPIAADTLSKTQLPRIEPTSSFTAPSRAPGEPVPGSASRPSYVAPRRPQRPAINAMEGKRLWIYGGGLIAIVLLAILFFRDHRGPAAAANAHAAQPAWPSHVVGPGPATGTPAVSSATVAPSPHASGTPAAYANWRVVAYTFNRESDAVRRADAIREKHPALNPGVFSPSGGAGPFLVTLGGPMTKEQAERLRQRARAAGLPRDTFIRNYIR